MSVVSGGCARAALQLLVASLVTTVLLAGFVALVVFCLLFQPGLIQYSVDSAAAADFNLTPATVSTTFLLGIVSHNPKNGLLSVLYDQAEFSVIYTGYGKRQELAVADRAALSELSPLETWIDVRAVAQATPVTDTTLQSLKMSLAAGELTVNISIRARVRFRFAGITTWRFDLRAFCTSLVINLSGLSFQQDKQCGVSFL